MKSRISGCDQDRLQIFSNFIFFSFLQIFQFFYIRKIIEKKEKEAKPDDNHYDSTRLYVYYLKSRISGCDQDRLMEIVEAISTAYNLHSQELKELFQTFLKKEEFNTLVMMKMKMKIEQQNVDVIKEKRIVFVYHLNTNNSRKNFIFFSLCSRFRHLTYKLIFIDF